MLDYLKKQRISFYLMAFSALLTIVGLIVFAVSNGVPTYGMSGAGWIIFAIVVAFILIGFGAYASARYGEKLWYNAVLFVAMILLCLSFGFALANRIAYAAELFTYDWSNLEGWRAFNTGIASFVIFLVASIVLTISAFLKQGTKE